MPGCRIGGYSLLNMRAEWNGIAASKVDAALYVNKHNPFVLMNDISSSPTRLAQIKPYSSFAADMKAKTQPNFVWISPNQCHDMHGGVYTAAVESAARISPPAIRFCGV